MRTTPPMRRNALVAAVATLAACLFACGAPAEPPPNPELSGVEPDVALAIERARAAVLEHPDSAAAWGRLGERFRRGEWSAEAERCFLEAERLEPRAFSWPYLAARAAGTREPERAVAAYSRAIAIDSRYVPVRIAIADRLVQLGRRDEARRHLDAALAHARDSADVHERLGQLALAEQDWERARDAFERAVATAPDHGPAHRSLARAYFALGRPELARRHADIAERLPHFRTIDDPRASFDKTPMGSVGHLEAGKRALRAGDLEGAVHAFSKAIELDPACSSARYRLAMTHVLAGRREDAVRHLRAYRELQPDSPDYSIGMAEMHTAFGELDAAAGYWRQSLEIRPDSATAHFALADVLSRTGRATEAERHVRWSLAIAPNEPGPRFLLGALLDRDGRDDEARTELERAMRLDPGCPRVREYLGAFVLREGDPERASEILAEAERLDPTVATRINLGIARIRAGRPGEAIAPLRAATTTDPGNAKAHAAIGRALAGTGDDRGAVAAYREARRLAPDAVNPMRRLARALATSPDDAVRDGAEAIRLAEHVVFALRKTSPEALDTLAAAYAEAGRFDDAVRTARRAIAVADRRGDDALAAEIGERLELYARNRPFRAAPPEPSPVLEPGSSVVASS